MLMSRVFLHVDEPCVPTATPVSACPDGWFTCQDKKCIPSQWHCDGDQDCDSDEEGCPYTCLDSEFGCHDNKTCVPKHWRCDGHGDCPDRSDELGCGGKIECHI